jgi:hypothetical protein
VPNLIKNGIFKAFLVPISNAFFLFFSRFGLQRHIESLHPDLKTNSRATLSSGKAKTSEKRTAEKRHKPRKKIRGPYKKNKKPWEDDENDKNDPKSDIEVLSSDSSETEVRYRVVFSPKKSQNTPKKPKKSPKKLTSHSRLELSWMTNLKLGGLKLEYLGAVKSKKMLLKAYRFSVVA